MEVVPSSWRLTLIDLIRADVPGHTATEVIMSAMRWVAAASAGCVSISGGGSRSSADMTTTSPSCDEYRVVDIAADQDITVDFAGLEDDLGQPVDLEDATIVLWLYPLVPGAEALARSCAPGAEIADSIDDDAPIRNNFYDRQSGEYRAVVDADWTSDGGADWLHLQVTLPGSTLDSIVVLAPQADNLTTLVAF